MKFENETQILHAKSMTPKRRGRENLRAPLPMEFANGKPRLTHVVAALSITDQQEADKLLGDPLSCHVCTVPDSHYLTPEVTFPVKTAQSVLKKVLDAAGGKFCSSLDCSLVVRRRDIALGWAPETNTVKQGAVQEASTLSTIPL